jgi:hypothetical protein
MGGGQSANHVQRSNMYKELQKKNCGTMGKTNNSVVAGNSYRKSRIIVGFIKPMLRSLDLIFYMEC